MLALANLHLCTYTLVLALANLHLDTYTWILALAHSHLDTNNWILTVGYFLTYTWSLRLVHTWIFALAHSHLHTATCILTVGHLLAYTWILALAHSHLDIDTWIFAHIWILKLAYTWILALGHSHLDTDTWMLTVGYLLTDTRIHALACSHWDAFHFLRPHHLCTPTDTSWLQLCEYEPKILHDQVGNSLGARPGKNVTLVETTWKTNWGSHRDLKGEIRKIGRQTWEPTDRSQQIFFSAIEQTRWPNKVAVRKHAIG